MVQQIAPVLLGELPGDTQSVVYYCSADGTVACGASIAADGHWTPVMWLSAGVSGPTAVSGTYTSGQSRINVCSPDGTQFGGVVTTGAPPGTPTIWNAAGTPTTLANPSAYACDVTRTTENPTLTAGWYGWGYTGIPGTQSALAWIGGAPDILPVCGSPGGTPTSILQDVAKTASSFTAVGYSTGTNDVPSLWTNITGTALNLLAGTTQGRVFSVDAAGDTAVGVCQTSSGFPQPVRWNLSTLAATALPLGDVSAILAYPFYISPDGTKIAGQNNNFAVIWSSGTPTELPSLPGGSYSQANAAGMGGDLNYNHWSMVACSDDGVWVMGFANDSSGNLWPVVWNNGTIIQLLLTPGAPPSSSWPIGNQFIANNGSAAFGTLSADASGNVRAIMWRLVATITTAWSNIVTCTAGTPVPVGQAVVSECGVVLMWGPSSV